MTRQNQMKDLAPGTTLYLFDDAVARTWDPFAQTRPVGEILFGAFLLRERTERFFGLPAAAHIAAPGLEGFEEEGAPPALAATLVPRDGARIVVSTRFVPDPSHPMSPDASGAIQSATCGLQVVRLVAGGDTVGWVLPPGLPLPQQFLSSNANPEAPAGGVPLEIELAGESLSAPWELVEANSDRLRRDLPFLPDLHRPEGARSLPELPGVTRLGDADVTAGDDVEVDPGVILDTRPGPIYLADGVRIRSFTTLVGPAFIGPGSLLLGGVIEAVSCGPVCRLRGEIASSVILGYTNKAHDGYLGHSLVGRWVNLGAFTTNSDLKNNYGSIRVPRGPASEVDTGRIKVGVFLGDHVKTGIGTLMGAGTVVGAGSNVFGGGIAPRWLLPFSWSGPGSTTPWLLDAFLDTASRAMSRRGITLSPGMRDFLTRAWVSAHGTGPRERNP